jgi:hypothetical protein
MSDQTFVNQDGQAPRVDYNLIGGGAIDYNDQMLLRLFNFFAKYQHIQNSEIAATYKEYKEWVEEITPGARIDYETIKNTIIQNYGLVIEEETQEAFFVDDSIPDDEPGNKDDSDDEFIIPAGAEIIELDQYEEPEIVELKKIKIEPGTENKKRKREIEDQPIAKIQKIDCQDFQDALNRAYFFASIRQKAKALRGAKLIVSDPLPPPVRFQ